MGVKDMWDILSPVKKEVSLEDLKGKVLAIDLSIWIMEATNHLPKHIAKPYLRHLFFRTCHLLNLNILPIIVLEGEPPLIKMQTIQNRLGLGKEMKNTTRSRFRTLHRECSELMACIGVPCIQAFGEAEGMCAYLNRTGLVDGVITNDGDAFLYGATVVYTHFTINQKNERTTEYRMDDIEAVLGLCRESLVGMAVLLGCDYVPKGVYGCGKALISKFSTLLKGQSMLKRFKFWLENQKSDLGSILDQVELSVARKAISCLGFPFPKVIEEYLREKENVDGISIAWKRPQLASFVKFTVSKMEWVESYAVSKLLPLLSLHHMTFPDDQSQPLIRPLKIVKKRIKGGIECYEVMWRKLDEDVYSTEDTYTTIEKQNIFGPVHPSIVSVFHAEIDNKKVTKNRTRKAVIKKEASDDNNVAKVEQEEINKDEDDIADALIERLEKMNMQTNKDKNTFHSGSNIYKVFDKDGDDYEDDKEEDDENDKEDGDIILNKKYGGQVEDLYLGNYNNAECSVKYECGEEFKKEEKNDDADDGGFEKYVPLRERLLSLKARGSFDDAIESKVFCKGDEDFEHSDDFIKSESVNDKETDKGFNDDFVGIKHCLSEVNDRVTDGISNSSKVSIEDFKKIKNVINDNALINNDEFVGDRKSGGSRKEERVGRKSMNHSEFYFDTSSSYKLDDDSDDGDKVKNISEVFNIENAESIQYSTYSDSIRYEHSIFCEDTLKNSKKDVISSDRIEEVNNFKHNLKDRKSNVILPFYQSTTAENSLNNIIINGSLKDMKYLRGCMKYDKQSNRTSQSKKKSDTCNSIKDISPIVITSSCHIQSTHGSCLTTRIVSKKTSSNTIPISTTTISTPLLNDNTSAIDNSQSTSELPFKINHTIKNSTHRPITSLETSLVTTTTHTLTTFTHISTTTTQTSKTSTPHTPTTTTKTSSYLNSFSINDYMQSTPMRLTLKERLLLRKQKEKR